MKISSLIYQSLLRIYMVLPFKIAISKIARSSNFLKKRKVYRDFTFTGSFLVRIKSVGKSFKLHNWSSTLETSIFWTGLEEGEWEPEAIPIWIKLCENAKIVFDIGANTGIYSLIAKTINPDLKVVAFEPSVIVVDKFKANMKLNNFDVTLIEKGVSNSTEKKIFYDEDSEHQTSSSLDPDKLKNFKNYVGKIREYNIDAIRLDDFIEQSGLLPDVIKIDVELHEPEVLEGMGKYLLESRAAIIIEVLTDDVANKLHSLLPDEEYQFFSLSQDKVQQVEKLIPNETVFNFLLLPKGKKLGDVI